MYAGVTAQQESPITCLILIFITPTHISFGQGCIAKLDDFVPADAKVMVLYGGQSAQRTGTLDEVKAALATRQVHFFGGVEANPTYQG